MSLVIGFLIGFVASLTVVAFLELCKRPYLTIKVGSVAEGQFRDESPYRFVHVSIRNKRASKLFSLISDRSVAFSCQARLEVRSADTGNRVIDEEIIARWAGTPEIVQPVSISPGSPTRYIPDITKLPMGRKMDIIPDHNEEIDIVIKFEDEPECYIFSNESYLAGSPLWRKPDWRLDKGIYDILVTVVCGSIQKSKHFILENRGPRREDTFLRLPTREERRNK